MEKQCSKCKVTKDVSNFYSNKLTTDGLQSQCKACQKLKYTTPEEKQLFLENQKKYNKEKRIVTRNLEKEVEASKNTGNRIEI